MMELELLSAAKLANVYQLQPDLANQFTDLRQCSTAFQKSFMDAWMAIEHGNMRRLKESIVMMKRSPDANDNEWGYLNVCYLQSTLAVRRGGPVVYYMSLLAFAAVMRQMEMVKMLISIENGADIQMGNQLSGTPLAQALVHCVHHNCPEILDIEIVQQLIDPSTINVIYYYHIPANPAAGVPWVCTQLEFALLLQRMDIVESLLNNGADLFVKPIYNAPSILFEYFEFGTSNLLSWLLDQYLHLDEIPNFIEKVIEADILQSSIVSVFTEWVHRHPAHAVLTCGNEEIAKKLLHHYSTVNLLAVKEPTGRTALQVATDQGNLQAVKVIVKLMTDDPGSRKDMAQALLAAARHNCINIVRYLLRNNHKLLQVEVAQGVELWKQAITEGLSNVYEVMRDFDQSLVLGLFDAEYNTLGHRAAALGNSELFKVTFPLKSLGVNTGKQEYGMFTTLTMKNQAGLTPLQVAIKGDQLAILKTLQEYVVKRTHVIGCESCMEKIEWDKFWEEWRIKLLLFACTFGTASAVKLLIGMGCEPDISLNGKTPLSAAAKSGRVETVHYLLHSCKLDSAVASTHNSKSSPLLLAAEYGHTRCVIILLEKGAHVNERCPKTGYNCLMKAIEKKHRDTVLAILIQDSSSLRFSKDKNTPMRMLIEHLPDVAEWVLSKCALEETNDSDIVDFIDYDVGFETNEGNLQNANEQRLQHDENGRKVKKFVAEHKFELFEDFQLSAPLSLPSQQQICSQLEKQNPQSHCTSSHGENWKQQYYSTRMHPIKLMVKFNRENLLTHPLVESWIQFKWYRVAVPGIVAYYSMYAAFLIFLTLFAVLIPRPGPQNVLCSGNVINNSALVNTGIENSTVDSNSCEGLSTSISLYLYISAVILIIFAVLYLILEVTQGLRRKTKYLKEYENYLQVVMFLLVIVFVFPVGHECWCYPSWRWQIGALTVFLAWLNSLTLLKDVPLFGQPVTMLFNVYLNFIKLIYLPILLILTFSFPFYMLFVRDIAAYEGEDPPGFLATFGSPIIALWSVILLSVDDLEARTTLDESQLLYPFLSYTLFIIFIIAMPLLFNNFLIGIAVGETAEERDKAAVTLIKNKINYIFEIENTLTPWLRKFGSITHDNIPKLNLDERQRIMLRNECDELKNTIKSKNRILNIKWDIKRLAGQLEQYQAEVKEMELKTKEELNTLHNVLQTELEGIKSLILERLYHK